MSTEGHNKAGAGADDELTLAQKLDHLFKTVFPQGRGPYTLREVSEGVARQEQLKREQLLRAGGRNVPEPVVISFSYLSQLRSGTKSNPSARQLAALAHFFAVPLAYLFGEGAQVEDEVDAEIALKQAVRDPDIAVINGAGAAVDESREDALARGGKLQLVQRADRTLAHKLDRLFKTVFPQGRGPYTLREVSEGVARQEQLKREQLLRGGARNVPEPVMISVSYLSQLRSGTKSNPSARQLAALAHFFAVPLPYLVGGDAEVDAEVDAEIALKQAVRDRSIRDLSLRASQPTPDQVWSAAQVALKVRGREVHAFVTACLTTALADPDALFALIDAHWPISKSRSRPPRPA